MIAVDTSALMAVILGEADSEKWIRILEIEPEILISAGTVAEALIALIARENARRLVRLGGSEPEIGLAPRRRR